MTGDSNPYAPPAVAETESLSAKYWHVDGLDLLAKNGTSLPQIDLDTGSEDGLMRAMPRVYEPVSFPMMARIVVMVGFVYLIRNLNLSTPLYMISVVGLAILLRRFASLGGGKNSRIQIWHFMEQTRFKRFTLRRRCRIAAMLVVFLGIVSSVYSNPTSFDAWLRWILPGGVALILGLAIWALFDRSRIRLRNGPPGWLLISNVHPTALARLQQLEREQPANADPTHKRLIRTTYYHRYPLRLLIGKNWKNPLLLLNIVLMKLLRSPLLVKETYHYSEAEITPAGQLCDEMRQAIDGWLASHPDWSFVSGDHLQAPAGDLTVENAILTSPGFEHAAQISRVWLQQKPAAGITQINFNTWTTDDQLITTTDHATLPLANPRVSEQRAKGTPGQVFQLHLQRTSGLPIQPCRNSQDLLTRIDREKEESDQILTRMGLQSEPREVDSGA